MQSGIAYRNGLAQFSRGSSSVSETVERPESKSDWRTLAKEGSAITA
jgi:hypothetical protein